MQNSANPKGNLGSLILWTTFGGSSVAERIPRMVEVRYRNRVTHKEFRNVGYLLGDGPEAMTMAGMLAGEEFDEMYIIQRPRFEIMDVCELVRMRLDPEAK